MLLIGVAVDDGPVTVIDLEQIGRNESRKAAYDSFISWFYREDTLLHAYNAAFEWYCLGRIGLGTPISRWRCTMAHGLYLGYSGTLGMMGRPWAYRRTRKAGHRQGPIKRLSCRTARAAGCCPPRSRRSGKCTRSITAMT